MIFKTYQNLYDFCQEHQLILLISEEEFTANMKSVQYICKCGNHVTSSMKKLKDNKKCDDCLAKSYREYEISIFQEIEDLCQNNSLILKTTIQDFNLNKGINYTCICGKDKISTIEYLRMNKMCGNCVVHQEIVKEISDICQSYGGTLLEPHNVTNKGKAFLYQCKCTRIGKIVLDTLIKNQMCIHCLHYEEAYNLCKDKGGELMTPRIEFTDLGKLYEWRCHCGEIVPFRYKYVKQYDRCIKCSSRSKSSYNEMKNFCEQSGGELLTLPEEQKSVNDGIVVKCKCGSIFDTRWNNYKNVGMCQGCTIKSTNAKKSGKDAITYESFVNELETCGYKMNDDKSKYRNTKSLLNIICDKGHSYESSYNRFCGKNPHRCKLCSDHTMTHSQEHIESEFLKRGFRLMDTYVNNKTDMTYMCKCGNISHITFSNLLKSIIGCSECVINNMRVDWNEVRDTFDDANCQLITQKSEYKNNNESMLEYFCMCGQYDTKTWKAFRKGARCDACTILKRNKTNMEKYGAENVFASEYGKQKIKEFFQESFDVSHVMKVPYIRERAAKTCKERYGTEYIFTTEENFEKARQAFFLKYGNTFGNVESLRQKQIQTTREKYDVDFPLMSKEIQEKIQNNNLTKYGCKVFIQSEVGKKLMMTKYGNKMYLQSEVGKKYMIDTYGNEMYLHSEAGKQYMLDTYGNKMYLQSEAGKQYMIDTYGYEHAMQNPEILAKVQKSAFRAKPYEMPSGQIINVQGYEHFCMDDLLKVYDEKDIMIGMENLPVFPYIHPIEDRVATYHPDAYIPKDNLIIEVKSVYTYFCDHDVNISKWNAAHAAGYDMVIYVYDPSGKTIPGFHMYTPHNYTNTWENVQSIFNHFKCQLLSEKHDFINDHTVNLRYICDCGTEDIQSLTHFQKGIRCDKCQKRKGQLSKPFLPFAKRYELSKFFTNS